MVRFTREGINSSLQVDDNKVKEKSYLKKYIYVIECVSVSGIFIQIFQEGDKLKTFEFIE